MALKEISLILIFFSINFMLIPSNVNYKRNFIMS